MHRTLNSIFNFFIVGLSLIGVGSYFFVALSRIGYPFTLEWIEANTYLHVLRILEMKGIFVAPSYDFIPMIYTPLYYYLAAIVAQLTGQVMFSIRLISVLASMVILAMIYSICRTRQLSPTISCLASGWFISAYGIVGYWFDIGRVDSLFVALLLTSYFLLISRNDRDQLWGSLAGLALCFSFATKQQAALAFPFMVLYLLLQRRWTKAIWFGLTFAISSVTYLLISNIISDGWFWFYIYTVPSSAPVSNTMLIDLWKIHLIPNYTPILLVIALSIFMALVYRARGYIENYLLLLVSFALPLLAMTYISLAKQWGYINGLLPLVVVMAIIGAEALHYLLTIDYQKSWMKVGTLLITLFLVISQFATLRYDISTQLPSSSNSEVGYAIIDKMKSSPQPIFVPTSPYLLHMIGLPLHFHPSSLGDLNLAAEYNPAVKDVLDEHRLAIIGPLNNNGIGTAILPNATWYDNRFSRENNYVCESLLFQEQALTTVTGAIGFLRMICWHDG